MLQSYLLRGLKTGAVGGLAFGLFVALVANPIVAATEALAGEHAHEAGGHAHGEAGHAASTGVLELVSTDATSVLAGGFWGLLLGVAVFGFAFYFLEPVLPGAEDTRSHLLGAAGFLTVSGAPWLVLPPQPPGVEGGLATDAGLVWYAGAMLAGALACGLSGFVYTRYRRRGRSRAFAAASVPLLSLLALPLAAPASTATATVPTALVAAFRALVVLGQLSLWVVLASAHAWLLRRADTDTPDLDAEAGGYETPTAD